MESGAGHRIGRRTVEIAERRGSLVRLLIALFVARIVVTVTEILESDITTWSVFVTAAIGIEAWRAWRVSRVPHAEGDGQRALPDTVWNRMLMPLERRGPVVLYVLSGAYAVAYVAVRIAGEPRDTLLDVAVISREVITFFFLGVLIAAYLSVRSTLRDEAPA